MIEFSARNSEYYFDRVRAAIANIEIRYPDFDDGEVACWFDIDELHHIYELGCFNDVYQLARTLYEKKANP